MEEYRRKSRRHDVRRKLWEVLGRSRRHDRQKGEASVKKQGEIGETVITGEHSK